MNILSTLAFGLVFVSTSTFGAALQSESFDSAADAAANGWTLVNGVGDWGWQNSNYAGGSPGEARVSSFTAGTQRYYADFDLGGVLSFNEDWQASGRMDFYANSQSDGGMFFGFFDRNTSLAANTQTLAGFLLVNDQLTLRFERRPNTTFLETSDFGTWVNSDRYFTLSYKANAGPNIGRLTASLTNLANNSTTTQSLDIDKSLVMGASLNSFGFYAMDFASGRPTPVSWAVDNLSYGPPQPTVSPTITGTLGRNGWYISAKTTLTWTVTGDPAPITSGCGTVSVPQTKGKTYTCSATNSLGSASDSVMIKKDSVKPQVTVSSPVKAKTYRLHQIVLASYSCLDAVSGVASCSGTVKNGTAINTSTTGTKTFTVVGTDKAGNRKVDSVLYSVK